MSRTLCVVGAVLLAALSGCGDDTATSIQVRIENVTPFQFLKSGVFNTPVGASAPGPLLPGDAYEVTFTAGKKQTLSFAAMFGASNDWFFAPKEGIALYDDAGNLRSGDVTSEVTLWNAGTEVDQEPGVGADTGPKQSAPDQGAADPDDTVREVPLSAPLSDGTTFDRPATADMIRVTLTPTGNPQEVTLRIENVSTATTLTTSEGNKTVGISPGVWTLGGALFTAGMKDAGHGLERIAESGNPADLSAYVAPLTGVVTGFSPGVWIVTRDGEPIFSAGQADRGQGLEHLAEAGNLSTLSDALMATPPEGTEDLGTFNTPEGASAAGPLLPGEAYVFTVTAAPGDKLSFATMFGASNDWFAAPAPGGIALFDADGKPVSGDVTGELSLWNAGTEQDEEPGVGPDTGPQQPTPDTGPADPDDTVRKVTSAQYATPISQHLRITLTPMSASEAP